MSPWWIVAYLGPRVWLHQKVVRWCLAKEGGNWYRSVVRALERWKLEDFQVCCSLYNTFLNHTNPWSLVGSWGHISQARSLQKILQLILADSDMQTVDDYTLSHQSLQKQTSLRMSLAKLCILLVSRPFKRTRLGLWRLFILTKWS